MTDESDQQDQTLPEFSQKNFDQVAQILSFYHACMTSVANLLPNMSASASPLGIISMTFKDRPLTIMLGVGDDMKDLMYTMYKALPSDGDGDTEEGD